MKRWKKTLCSLLLGVCLLLSSLACAASLEKLTEGDYKYTVANGKVTITEYIGEGGNVIVPSSLGGYPVIAIEKFAFDSCADLVHLTVPDNVERLGEGAFMNCTQLTSVVLP